VATDILTELQQRGLAPRKASAREGGEYHSPCPGCGGTDRFHAWPEQKQGGTYWCRQCDKAGDLIQFLMDFENLSYREACARIGRETVNKRTAAYSAPRRPKPHQAQPPQALGEPAARPPEKWLEKAAAFVKWSQEQLAANPGQLAYLAGRGIPAAAVAAGGLGYNPGENGKDIFRPREAWGLPPVEKKKSVWIPRGIVIPHREAGQVVRVRIRREQDDELPRYYVLPGSTMQTMVRGEVKRAAMVIEAELDAVMVGHQAGDLVRTVALGAAKTKPDARAAALLDEAAVILVALDFDKTGEDAVQWWTSRYPQARHWPAPQGKDPGDAFKAGVDIRAWVAAGLPEGWTLGQAARKSALHKRAPAASPEPPAHPAAPADAGPIERLAGLLRENPEVRIYHTSRRVKLLYPEGWSTANWQALGEISELVYFGSGVIDYILEHPRRVITAENIIPKGGLDNAR